jgi:hypothetical protein
VERLTANECRALLDCLGYSIKKIQDYMHREQKHKEDSLKPLLDLQTKLRLIRDGEKK